MDAGKKKSEKVQDFETHVPVVYSLGYVLKIIYINIQ